MRTIVVPIQGREEDERQGDTVQPVLGETMDGKSGILPLTATPSQDALEGMRKYEDNCNNVINVQSEDYQQPARHSMSCVSPINAMSDAEPARNMHDLSSFTLDHSLEYASKRHRTPESPIPKFDNKRLVTTAPFIEEIPKLKTQVVQGEGFEQIGEEWKGMTIISRVCAFNYAFWVRMSARCPQIGYQLWTTSCLMGACGFFVDFLMKNLRYSSTFSFALLSLLVLLNIAYVGCGLVALYYHIYLKVLSDSYVTFSTWVQCVYSGISIYFFIALAFESESSALCFLAALVCPTIIQSLNIVMWVGVTIILLLAFSVEAVVRVFTCKLQCPYVQQKKREYHYSLYSYQSMKKLNAIICPICISEYSKSDTELCVLLCATSHVFHERCLFEWLKKQDNCPVCRGPINFNIN